MLTVATKGIDPALNVIAVVRATRVVATNCSFKRRKGRSIIKCARVAPTVVTPRYRQKASRARRSAAPLALGANGPMS